MNPNKLTKNEKPSIENEDKSVTGSKPPKISESTLRSPGGMKGQIGMADDFDAPMSEEELALWYDAPIYPNNK